MTPALTVNDVMSLIVDLRGDVWLLWGLLATFNTALIGWLLERGSAFRPRQKLVATGGYALFCLVIATGFWDSYRNLAAVVNDLEAAVKVAKPADDGLVQVFLKRDYESYRNYAVGVTTLSFAFVAYLIWSRRFWALEARAPRGP